MKIVIDSKNLLVLFYHCEYVHLIQLFVILYPTFKHFSCTCNF